MAQTRATTSAGNAGMPPDLATKPVAGGKRASKPPTPPADDIEQPFWPWLAGFTTDDWQFLIVYAWRVSPLTERRSAGKPTAIGKYARPFDIDTILKEHGSGHYRFDVCQIQPTGNKQDRIRQHYEVIIQMDFPPRVPLGDWINDPDNEMWRWAEEPLKLQQAQAQARIKAIEDGPPKGMTDPAAMFGIVLNGMRELRGEQSDNAGLAGQLLTLVMNNQQAMAAMTDPTKQLTTIKALMNELSPPAKGEDAATMMLAFMKDQVTALRDELKQMRLAGQGKSFTDQLREFTTVFTEVAPSLGFSKRGTPGPQNNPPNETEQVISTIGNVITQVLEKGQVYVPLIQHAMMRGNGIPPPPPGWNPPATQLPAAPVTQPQQQPTPAPQEAIDMSTMTPEQREAVKALDTKMQACWAKHQALITELTPFVVHRFKKKETGYEFRDWFLDDYGALAWNQLRDDSGPEVLTTLSGLHPYLKTVLGPPELVLQYFTEFFTEQGQEPEGTVVPDPDEENGDDDAA